MGVVSNVGGQTVAILAIVNLLLKGYAQFAYDRDALQQLYFQTKDDGPDEDADGNDARLSESGSLSWKFDLKQKFKDR